ncbi:MAG: hypothetical protein NTV15_00285 [Candidatus Bathyarchaeota archaeon]|nr:hypothetical protein [Candidatus Bathyarchaeota archaeon]
MGKRVEKRNTVQVDKTDMFNGLQKIFMQRPMLIFGLPGIISVFVGLGFFAWALDLFIKSSYLSTNIILIASVAMIVGLLLLFTGIILRAITSRASIFPWSS